MKVIFKRTGERRYLIKANRPGMPTAIMDPAPGYDDLLPHDVMHMVVEAALGLEGGVFGQLSGGGLAGTFRVVPENGLSKREVSRQKRRFDTLDKSLLKNGRKDSETSERATYLCWFEWLLRSEVDARRGAAKKMAANAKHIRAIAPPEEMDALTRRVIDRVCGHLDELSSCWSGLAVGESMAVGWPDLKVERRSGVSSQEGK